MMKFKHNRKITSITITFLLLLSFSESSIIRNTLALETNTEQSNPVLNYEKDNWWLTNIELLTGSSTDYSIAQDMVIDSNNNIHVVWEDHTDGLEASGTDIDIFYKLYDATTETWSADELVSTESTADSKKPCLGVDSVGNVHVCWQDRTDYLSSGTDDDVFYKMRSPIGVWSTTSVLTLLSTGYVDNIDLEIDSDDNIHVAYEDPTDILGAGVDEDIFYLWFNNSLALWTTAYLVSAESTSDSLKASIAINPVTSEPYFAWNDGTDLLSNGLDSDIFTRFYDHITSSFSSVTLVSAESTNPSYNPDIAFNSKGVPHVFWYDYTNMLGSGADGDIFHKYLNTITNEWVGLELISPESDSNTGPPQCVIDKEDRMFVLWEDYSDILGAGTDLDLFFKLKDPTSNVWSAMKLISEESTNFISLSTLGVDSEGFVSFVYYDHTNILSAGIDADLFYKKFVGTPNDPFLSVMFPNPSTDGNISLNWMIDPYITSYSLYRSTSPFTAAALGSMEPLATLSSNTYIDLLNVTGVYYYGVVAHNDYGDSGLSNVESVQFPDDSAVGGTFFSFLSSIGILEILTIAGVIILSQVLISLLISSIVKGGSKGGKSKGTTKKKK